MKVETSKTSFVFVPVLQKSVRGFPFLFFSQTWLVQGMKEKCEKILKMSERKNENTKSCCKKRKRHVHCFCIKTKEP